MSRLDSGTLASLVLFSLFFTLVGLFFGIVGFNMHTFTFIILAMPLLGLVALAWYEFIRALLKTLARVILFIVDNLDSW